MGVASVTIYPVGGSEEEHTIEVEDVDFLSLVNHDTFGKPPIISDEGRDGVSVLYVNTQNIVAVLAVRED